MSPITPPLPFPAFVSQGAWSGGPGKIAAEIESVVNGVIISADAKILWLIHCEIAAAESAVASEIWSFW